MKVITFNPINDILTAFWWKEGRQGISTGKVHRVVSANTALQGSKAMAHAKFMKMSKQISNNSHRFTMTRKFPCNMFGRLTKHLLS